MDSARAFDEQEIFACGLCRQLVYVIMPDGYRVQYCGHCGGAVSIPPRFKHLGVSSLDPAMSKLGAMDADAVARWL